MKYFLLTMLFFQSISAMSIDEEVEKYGPMIDPYCSIKSADQVPHLAGLHFVLNHAKTTAVQIRAKLVLTGLYAKQLLGSDVLEQDCVVSHLEYVLEKGNTQERAAAQLNKGRIYLQQEDYAAALSSFEVVEKEIKSMPEALANEVLSALATIREALS